MTTWLRTAPIRKQAGIPYDEIWNSKRSSDDSGRNYNLNVLLGKPVDILSLKANMVENFRNQITQFQTTRRSLYQGEGMETVKECPICREPAQSGQPALTIYNGSYHRCRRCEHYFVLKRPSKFALEQFYSKDTHYASTYTDRRTLETRVREVATPKAQWVIDQFVRLYGRKPSSILDVGAGSGHFVYACRQLGLAADGVELSGPSREFARQNFNIELYATDFTQGNPAFQKAEIITFWGVIEHVSNPMDLLQSACRLLKGKASLVVAAVPRWDSMSTKVQSIFSDSVVRHLDPLGHINCFTDNSVATAFEDSRLAPVAAWYFGMDAYEFAMQLSQKFPDNPEVALRTLGQHIPLLQEAVDQGQLSDEIALAGVPFDERRN